MSNPHTKIRQRMSFGVKATINFSKLRNLKYHFVLQSRGKLLK